MKILDMLKNKKVAGAAVIGGAILGGLALAGKLGAANDDEVDEDLLLSDEEVGEDSDEEPAE